MPRLTIEISNQAICEIFSKEDDAPYIFGHYSSFSAAKVFNRSWLLIVTASRGLIRVHSRT